MHAAARPHNIGFGIALIIATALAISVQDVVFKVFSTTLTLWQIFALRGLFSLPALLAIGAAQGQFWDVARGAMQTWAILRALCLTTTFLAFYAAIPFLSLSTVGAANYIAPIFVALLSAYVIGETVGRMGWLGVVLGFAGVIVLLQPGSDAFSFFALLPVMGAAFYAIGHVITRTRCQEVPTAALALSVNATMFLSGVVISLVLYVVPQPTLALAYPYIFGQWATVALADWSVLLVLAGFIVANSIMLATAYKIAPPATVATFEYSYLVFVALWDILFFGMSPTPVTLVGMAMIVIAGLLVMRGRV